MNKNIRSGLISFSLGALLALSSHVSGDSIKLNPIKPVTSRGAVTDEQQGILAVRKAKASVVNIMGLTDQQPPTVIKLEASEVSGTGFVWSKDGYIVTNQHVVSDQAGQYSVIFSDGKSYTATVVGRDKFNDIALLKIDATNLTPASLGDSDGLETGQSVFAIGNSLGKYQNTVTRGVVSGLARSISVSESPRLQNLIQTDASINPGNSGGPLINLAGDVVGMNTAIDSTAQGIGFAVPVNLIRSSVETLKASGKVTKPYLGLSFVSVDPIIKKQNNLSVDAGAIVAAVTAGSPAAAAGILPGDIITQVNRRPVNLVSPLDTELSRYQAGNQILVELVRGKETIDLPVILGEFK